MHTYKYTFIHTYILTYVYTYILHTRKRKDHKTVNDKNEMFKILLLIMKTTKIIDYDKHIINKNTK
jgi:hypothetical protein